MRKGQEKLIKRAEKMLPKEFVEKLMDESFTIEQLESLFRWMLLFKDYPEILDDWDAFCQDAFSFKHICATTGDWRRTHELCTYMREKFHDCRYHVMNYYWQAFAHRIYFAKKDDQYLFNKDDMTHILDYIRDHILCNDYSDCKSSENFLGVSDEFSDYSDFMYKFIKVNSGIGFALVLIEEGTCSKDMDEILRIIRLTSQMVNGGMEARARCYIKAGITDEEWIRYEQMIEDNVFNRDIVAAEIAFRYYPGFKDLIDSIMERNDASLYFISNELGNGYSSGRINFTNTEVVEPFFNTCTKLDCAEFASRKFLLANKYMSFEEFMKTYCVHAKRIYIDPEIKRVDSRRYVVKRFLSEIIQKRVGADIDPIIYDYIDMSEMLHRKISIMFTSEKKVNDAHDDLAKELTAKNTPNVKVPKNSKFNRLAKLLPDDMEWIKSKRRLVREGSEMHNCVAEYANKINKDSCAIYSFVYNNKRYTVEFVAYKNRYSIKQLYGVCNSEPEAGVEDYVKGFLAE